MVAPHHGAPHTDGDGGVSSPYVPPAWQGTYRGPQPDTGAAYDEVDVSDKTGPVARKSRLTAEQHQTLRLQNAQRRESLSASNAAIASILDAVDRSGEADQTYVIFTSDNGMMIGEHRYLRVKNEPYEPASRLPFAIRGPGLQPGTTYPHPAGMMDVAPTVLELAGADSSVEMDGHSVLPGARPNDVERDRAVLLMAARGPVDAENGGAVRHAPRVTSAQTDYRYRGIVTRRWKLIRWTHQRAWELYDLRNDKGELENLSDRPEWQPVQSRLQQRLANLWDCSGPACDR
jgi:arylsulfatase A-like enzyme